MGFYTTLATAVAVTAALRCGWLIAAGGGLREMMRKVNKGPKEVAYGASKLGFAIAMLGYSLSFLAGRIAWTVWQRGADGVYVLAALAGGLAFIWIGLGVFNAVADPTRVIDTRTFKES